MSLSPTTRAEAASPTTRLEKLVLALLVAIRLTLDSTRYLTNPERYWNWEDNYNAAVGWYAVHAGLWDQLLTLQYKTFCGGCTVNSVLAAPILALGGDHLVLWKAVGLLWTTATLLTGFWAISAHAGRRAGWSFALLFAVPPLGVSDLSLMLWGNHNESMYFVFLALACVATGRSALAGLSMGIGLWFCRTTILAPIVLLPLAPASREGRWRVIAGLLAGASLIAIPAANGDHGTYQMDLTSNLLPYGTGEAAERAFALWKPEQMGLRLYTGLERTTTAGFVWMGGALVGLLVLASDRTRGWARFVLPGMVAVFAVLYAISGFPMARMTAQGALMNMRYHAPWMMLLMALAASALTSRSWRGRGADPRGVIGWRASLGGIGVVAMLGADVWGWTQSLRAFAAHHETIADAWAIRAVHHPGFSGFVMGRLDPARVAHSDDPRTEASLRRMDGYRASKLTERLGLDATGGTLAGATLAAWGQGVTDPIAGWAALAETNAWLATLPPDQARVLGAGMAANLMFGVSNGAPPLPGTRPRPLSKDRAANAVARGAELLARATTGAPEGVCWTCRAVGPAIADMCRDRKSKKAPEARAADLGRCLGTAIPSLTFQPDLAYGAGMACAHPGASPAACHTVAAALPPALAAEFLAGLDDPLAGADRPFLAHKPGEK